MEERLRQRWGEQTSALVSAPAGRLWGVSGERGGGLALLILTRAAPANRLVEQLARFAAGREQLKSAPGLLWPSHDLPDPTLPALYLPLTGQAAEPLPVFLQRAQRPWTTRRLCGQLVALVEGLKALHEAGRVHGAVSPLGVAVEQLADEHALRWMYHELWEPLRELGLDGREVLGVAAGRGGALAKPTQAADMQQLGHMLAWLRARARAGCPALSDSRWPAALDELSARCASASPPTAAQALRALQDALADWDSLPDAPAAAAPPAAPLDPRTAACDGAEVALTALGDEADPSPHPSASGQSIAVRIPHYVGQAQAHRDGHDPPHAATPADAPAASPSDPAAHRNLPMPAPEDKPTPDANADASPPAAPTLAAPPKGDDEEEPTTMVLSREGLSGLFQDPAQRQAAEEAGLIAPEKPSRPEKPSAPAPPPTPTAPKAPKPPAAGRPRRRKKSTRSDINPENQVVSVRHNLSARNGLTSQPAVLVLIALLVVAIVLLILLLLKSNAADAQPAQPTPPAGVSGAATPQQRLVLPARSGTAQEQVAVNPAGDSYAACAGEDVWLWSTRAPAQSAAPALLDRFGLGGEGCAALRFSHDGALVYVVTRRGGLLRYHVASGDAEALAHGLPQRARLTDVQPLRGSALLLFTARAHAGAPTGDASEDAVALWRWDAAAPSSPPQRLRASPFGAAVTATRQMSQRS